MPRSCVRNSWGLTSAPLRTVARIARLGDYPWSVIFDLSAGAKGPPSFWLVSRGQPPLDISAEGVEGEAVMLLPLLFA